MKWLYYTVLLLACCRMAGCGSDKDSVSVLPSDPPAPEEPEYVDPTAGFKEVGPYGSMEDMIPDEHPDSEFSQCYYNYFCLCNKSSHTLTVAVSSKWKNIGGFLRPGTKYTRNFGQEVFGTYRDGPIESFDDIRSISVIYDKNVSDDPINADFFHTVSERYLFPSEDDFTGTIGDENEWIFEKFTDRRLRWVYIFTDEDYDRAKAMYDERMETYLAQRDTFALYDFFNEMTPDLRSTPRDQSAWVLEEFPDRPNAVRWTYRITDKDYKEAVRQTLERWADRDEEEKA